MPRAMVVETGDGVLTGHMVFCPACNKGHFFKKGIWTFDGNFELPSFEASMLVQGADEKGEKTVCHSLVKRGQIQYLGDCTHHLKNQTVELPDFDTFKK